MVFAVRDLMQDAYPELKESADRVSKAVLVEETRFAHALDIGFERLEDGAMRQFMNAPGVRAPNAGQNWTLDMIKAQGLPLTYPGDHAFKLYDTYGLPLDFIIDFCRDLGISFDQQGFDHAMQEQRERARASWKGAAKQTANPIYQQLPKSEFEGYRQTRSDGCEVLALKMCIRDSNCAACVSDTARARVPEFRAGEIKLRRAPRANPRALSRAIV